MGFINEAEWYKQAARDNPGMIEAGDYSYGDFTVNAWDDSTKLRIGKFCQIAQDTMIMLGGEHDRQRVSTYPFDIIVGGKADCDRFTSGNITIGNDVWIGARCTILSGVIIGDGSIIGAGSVLRKNLHIPPYSIVMGNPAEVVSWRYDGRIVDALLRIAWWNWTIEKVKEVIPMLRSRDIESFISKYDNGVSS